MAVQGPFQVGFGQVFPFGLLAVGAVQPLADFDASTKDHKVQSRDPDTGLPIWTVDVTDCDPEARERSFKVKIAADRQPVLPDPIPGAPVHPIVLEGLTVTPYLKEAGTDKKTGQQRFKIAYSLRASGLSAPRQRATDSKAA